MSGIPAGLRAIVSGDDFGLTPSASRAVLERCGRGELTAVSALATAVPGAALFRQLRSFPAIDVGVHLNLTAGRPLSPPAEVPTLVDGAGRFPGHARFLARYLAGRVRFAEVALEFDRQVGRLRDVGLAPTHLDAHEHLHIWGSLMAAALAVARRHGIERIRNPYALTFRPSRATFRGLRGLGKYLLLARPFAAAFRRGVAPLRCPDGSLLVEPGLAPAAVRALARLADRRRTGSDGRLVEIVTHPGGPGTEDEPATDWIAAVRSAGGRTTGYRDV